MALSSNVHINVHSYCRSKFLRYSYKNIKLFDLSSGWSALWRANCPPLNLLTTPWPVNSQHPCEGSPTPTNISQFPRSTTRTSRQALVGANFHQCPTFLKEKPLHLAG